MDFSVRDIPSGEAGTDITLRALGDLVNRSTRKPFIRLKALSILRSAGLSGRDHYAAARALFYWVRSSIRYVNDPVNVETIQSPEITLKLSAGDCDDHSALVAALAMNIGIVPRFRVVGLSRQKFQHIYPELFIGGKWVPADTTETASFGEYPVAMPETKFYSFAGEPIMSGIGQNQAVVQVERSKLIDLVYRSTLETIQGNWRNGIINRGDLKSYLRVIDEGNSPGHGTFADVGMRKAIQDFLNLVEQNQIRALKPETMTSLQGMDGFLSSIWKGVKKVVGGVIKTVTGGGTTEVVVQAPAPAAAVTTTAPGTGFGDLFSNPMVLGLVGLTLFLAFKK